MDCVTCGIPVGGREIVWLREVALPTFNSVCVFAGSGDQCVDIDAAGGIVAGEWVGAGGEEEFDDLGVSGLGFVGGGPDCATEDGAAVVISGFEGGTGADEKFDYVLLTAIRGPVEGVETGAGASAGIEIVG